MSSTPSGKSMFLHVVFWCWIEKADGAPFWCQEIQSVHLGTEIQYYNWHNNLHLSPDSYSAPEEWWKGKTFCIYTSLDGSMSFTLLGSFVPSLVRTRIWERREQVQSGEEELLEILTLKNLQFFKGWKIGQVWMEFQRNSKRQFCDTQF